MGDISVIGIDLAKRVFQLCALDDSGEILWTKRFGRKGFERFMAGCCRDLVVGLEACGGAHYWGRWLEGHGFSVKMMSPVAVKAYIVGGHKSDARDARAIAEAATRAHVSSVRIKSVAAQGLQALVRVRDRQTRQRTQIVNQLRALLAEFGFVAPKGHGKLLMTYRNLALSGSLGGLPDEVFELFETLYDEAVCVNARIDALTVRLKAAARRDERCALAMTVPHIGPINAALCGAMLEAPDDFANGRAFAACLGLVPRQHASGEKSALRAITKHGNKQLRRNLVLAAQTLLIQAQKDASAGRALDRVQGWALSLLARKHRNVAVTAVAARLARIVWAVLAHGNVYSAVPHHEGTMEAKLTG